MPPPSPHQLRDQIQAARQQHARGAGTVLDILLRDAQDDGSAIKRELLTVAGVAAFTDADALRPDHALLDSGTSHALRCVAFHHGGNFYLGLEDPWAEELIAKACAKLGAQPLIAALTTRALEMCRAGHAGARPGVAQDQGASTAIQVDGPIVSFVDTAIRAGYLAGASDIHFECDRVGVTVKHRLDGVMTHFARMDGTASAQEVISRIKVLAQLDITERRLPQDGRFRFHTPDHMIDLRVSIMPSVFGEDAVLRLLDKAQLRTRDELITLGVLGFDDHSAQLIRDLANEPSGMLLVTGPTGSGKTTTVYAVLTEINNGDEKIITIEDPVEYELPGVLQIPVNERKGLTFAKGLRSILRHDPDRILVGEIRDAETAEIAVQSALTGHLVFTTVHANGVADIMGRFKHFGLDMFGFMSSLNGLVVQRLMRQLCPHCAIARPSSEREQRWFQQLRLPKPLELPATKGCEQCHFTGYKGRFVVAEVHAVDDVLRDHVTEGAPMSVLKQHVYSREGVKSLAELAAGAVLNRRTTLEEVKRVVGWL
jgi:general secretion pathway protein E